MAHEDCKTVLYRENDGSSVAEIPALPGCYRLMTTGHAALSESTKIFALIADEFPRKGRPLPANATEIINA